MDKKHAVSHKELRALLKIIMCAELDVALGRISQFSILFNKQENCFERGMFSGDPHDKIHVLIWQEDRARPINEIYALCDDRSGQSLLEEYLRFKFANIIEWGFLDS